MTKQEAIDFFGGTQASLAERLGISQGSVGEWGEYPPPLRQIQMEMLSKKRLRAEPDVFKKKQAA